MGLDMRVDFKPKDETKPDIQIMEGNGRSMYRFLRNWIGDERYGQYIPLTEESCTELIDKALEQEMADGFGDTNGIELMTYIASTLDGDLYGATQFIRVLSVIKATLRYFREHGMDPDGTFTVEADW